MSVSTKSLLNDVDPSDLRSAAFVRERKAWIVAEDEEAGEVAIAYADGSEPIKTPGLRSQRDKLAGA